jgi:hypothetical protein
VDASPQPPEFRPPEIQQLPEIQELVERRGALRSRMVELRASTPEDHDGFLRTVDQLLAVSNQIIDRLNGAPGPAGQPEPSPEASDGGAGGDGPSSTGLVESGAQEAAAGGAEDDTR